MKSDVADDVLMTHWYSLLSIENTHESAGFTIEHCLEDEFERSIIATCSATS